MMVLSVVYLGMLLLHVLLGLELLLIIVCLCLR